MPQVLIVDDERFQRLLLMELLSSDDSLSFVQAGDGPECLELIRSQPVDLVLLDIMMPGMDGLEVCRQIKADPDLRSIPVILIAALPPQLSSVRHVNIPADGFVSKPFEKEDLRAKVFRALNSKGG